MILPYSLDSILFSLEACSSIGLLPQLIFLFENLSLGQNLLIDIHFLYLKQKFFIVRDSFNKMFDIFDQLITLFLVFCILFISLVESVQ